MTPRGWTGSLLLIVAVIAAAAVLAAWKYAALERADAQAADQSEPAESIQVAIAQQREHKRTTTSIGTVVATRSISVRNELPGTVRRVALAAGQIVAAGTVLIALDVAVEEAELLALRAQAELAQTQLARMQRMIQQRAASEMELDHARAERDVALAQIARTQAIIERKTIRAPFRARVGISDVHPGQYLNEGTHLTTLQGVDDSAYVDFTVAQQVASQLRAGASVEVVPASGAAAITAEIIAVDARVDPATRNATVRARIRDTANAPAPGASVRVEVPVELPRLAVAIPASALRKGPGGDHVFVVTSDEHGKTRAHLRPVHVETMTGDEVMIRQGLMAGEQVAASGSFKLRDAVLVAVSGPAATVAAAAAAAAGASP